jgi:hypothetical protein
MMKKRILVLIFLFLLFVPALLLILSKHGCGNDFIGFLNGSNRLLAKQYLYEGSRNGVGVTWPPFFMVFMAPWALLSKVGIRTTQVLWYFLNCFLLFQSIDLWCRLVYKKPCAWFDYRKPLSLFSPFVFLPILFVSGPLLYNAEELQVSILLLDFISLGIYQMKKNMAIASGFWFGLAAAIKAFPLIFLVYLLFQRKLKAAAMLAATATILTLLPIVWYGPHDYFVNLKGWCAISFHGDFPIFGSAQSVYPMLGRWMSCDVHTMLSEKLMYPPLDATGKMELQCIHKGLFILIMSVFYGIICFRRYRDSAFEGAFIFLMAILFSPIAWKHYWVFCFPALVVLWKIAITCREKVITKLLWLFLIFIPPFEIFIVGLAPPVFRNFINRVVSNYTISGILLLAAMIYWASRADISRWKEEAGKSSITTVDGGEQAA